MKFQIFNKLNTRILSLSLGVFSWFIAKKAQALNFAEISGLSKTANNAGYPEGLNTNPEELVIRAISLVLSFIGVLFMLLMIYGGLIWMTAKGNESEVEKAKKIISAGLIGVIIVLGAYAISYFVVNFFSESSLR